MFFLKKLTVVFLSSIILLLAFASTISVQADAGEERTVYLSATEYDYPPFSVTDSGEADGFSVELLKAVAEEMGIEVTFKIDQWSVLKEELKNGELDILPLVGYTEERDEIYDFTVPYIVMRGNIFVRKGENAIQSEEDLFGKEILVLDGDNSQEWAWSIGLDSELTATATYLEAFQLLSIGQYDAVLAQGLVGEKLISDHNIENVEPVYVYDDGGVTRQKLDLEGYEQKFCFAVVEGDTELLSILNEGLSIISVNGTYGELYQKWFPFLHEDQGVTTEEIIKYTLYVLVPVLIFLITSYFITTKRTIKKRTAEIKEEKKRAEKYLHDLILAGKIFETSIENAPVPIMMHCEDGEVVNISIAWTRLSGYSKEDIPTIYEWTEKAYGAKKEDVREFISKLYSLDEMQHDGEFEVRTKDGRLLIWDFYSMHVGELPDGRVVTMSVAIDTTNRKHIENLLEHQKDLMSYVIEHSNAGVAVHDLNLDYIYVSQKYLEQYDIHGDVIGKHHYEVFPDLPLKWRDVHQRTLKGEVISGDRDLFVKSDGTRLWTRWESRPWVNENGDISGLIIYTEVINKEIEAEQQREHLMLHDQLTGLKNRLYFEKYIEQVDEKQNYPISLINFDINGLIMLNEAFGYDKGNEFIKFVSRTLEDEFCTNCPIFRVGGDQFVVLIKNSSNEKAMLVAKETAEQVKNYSINGINLSIAYGVATINHPEEDLRTLFQKSENKMYSNKIFESQSYRNNSIKSLIKAYHEKNPREEEHSHRVSELCEVFGKKLNLDQDDINKLKAISYLHDIGKIAIDEAILNKPGKLSDKEWEKIRKHPEMGARIVATSDEYSVIADDILAHHERFDGKGYPRGLVGEDIPLRARIISIIDSFDAMTSDRPYRKGMTHKEAIDELLTCSGTQFDPKLVDVFVNEVLLTEK